MKAGSQPATNAASNRSLYAHHSHVGRLCAQDHRLRWPYLILFLPTSHAENVRVYAAITRLQTGVLSQQSVMDRSRQCLGNQMPKTTRSQPDDTALENRVATVEGRLQKLENEGKNATLHIKPVEY
jgi:hypothetical protein